MNHWAFADPSEILDSASVVPTHNARRAVTCPAVPPSSHCSGVSTRGRVLFQPDPVFSAFFYGGLILHIHFNPFWTAKLPKHLPRPAKKQFNGGMLTLQISVTVALLAVIPSDL